MHLHYVDRGDPAVPDWLLGGLTFDGSWYKLAKIPPIWDVGAELVHFACLCKADGSGKTFRLREALNVNAENVSRVRTQAPNVPIAIDFLCRPSPEGQIEYVGQPGTFNLFELTVRGWWIVV